MGYAYIDSQGNQRLVTGYEDNIVVPAAVPAIYTGGNGTSPPQADYRAAPNNIHRFQRMLFLRRQIQAQQDIINQAQFRLRQLIQEYSSVEIPHPTMQPQYPTMQPPQVHPGLSGYHPNPRIRRKR